MIYIHFQRRKPPTIPVNFCLRFAVAVVDRFADFAVATTPPLSFEEIWQIVAEPESDSLAEFLFSQPHQTTSTTLQHYNT